MCQDLKARGRHGEALLVSDQPAGLGNARQWEWQGPSWQRGQAHCTRRVLDAGPQTVHDPCHAARRAVFAAPDRKRADRLRPPHLADLATTAPHAVAILAAGIEGALAIVAYPAEVRLRRRTTHDVERLNREIQRRERVVRIVPNRASAERL